VSHGQRRQKEEGIL
jgi:hypothetical protein